MSSHAALCLIIEVTCFLHALSFNTVKKVHFKLYGERLTKGYSLVDCYIIKGMRFSFGLLENGIC